MRVVRRDERALAASAIVASIGVVVDSAAFVVSAAFCVGDVGASGVSSAATDVDEEADESGGACEAGKGGASLSNGERGGGEAADEADSICGA